MKQVTITVSLEEYELLLDKLQIGVDSGNAAAEKLYQACKQGAIFTEDDVPKDIDKQIAQSFDLGHDFVETVKAVRNKNDILLMQSKKLVENFLIRNEKYHSNAPDWLLDRMTGI